MMHKRIAISAMCLLFLVGCSEGGDGEPKGRPPASSVEKASGATVETQTLDFELPVNWELLKPSSSMRIAQARIPGSAGPGELAVFYFGAGQGGGVDANIDRWVQQMEVSSDESPKRDAFQVADFLVTWVDVTGTLKPSSMGMGPATEQPNYRLLGAVVEGSNGPWFFKATGPDQTLSTERDAFLAMLRTVRSK